MDDFLGCPHDFGNPKNGPQKWAPGDPPSGSPGERQLLQDGSGTWEKPPEIPPFCGKSIGNL